MLHLVLHLQAIHTSSGTASVYIQAAAVLTSRFDEQIRHETTQMYVGKRKAT